MPSSEGDYAPPRHRLVLGLGVVFIVLGVMFAGFAIRYPEERPRAVIQAVCAVVSGAVFVTAALRQRRDARTGSRRPGR